MHDQIRLLNALAPDLLLGNLLLDVITAHNKLVADHDSLVDQHNALLAHLDTANAAGIGNGNAAAYGATQSGASAPALGSL
jgi:hypothetical protein